MSKNYNYEIKFKRFTNGVWDGIFRNTTICAENEFQAVFQHGQNNGVDFPDQTVEDVILMVNGGQQHSYFEEGRSYETLDGSLVTMKKFKDLEGRGRTGYESIMDENGHHRYSRRDRGRCIGSHTNDPKNIQLGVFWMRMDMDDPYDYIMERKHKNVENME